MNHNYAAVLGCALALLGTAAHAAAPAGSGSRQEQVARQGANVMPFDLARTSHFFADRKTGGIETVTANDGRDKSQAALIRAHLAAEAKRFARGDFSDPATIHGNDMPGLAELARAGKKLRVTYKDVPAGASLSYSSRDPGVIAAIHEWFSAQRSDHGAHMHMHQE